MKDVKNELLEEVIKFLKCATPADDRSREYIEKVFKEVKSSGGGVKYETILNLFTTAKLVLESMKDDERFEERVRRSMELKLDRVNDALANNCSEFLKEVEKWN